MLKIMNTYSKWIMQKPVQNQKNVVWTIVLLYGI